MNADAAIDLNVIEHLDFDPTLPCEHSMHAVSHAADQQASWVARVACVGCHMRATYMICDSGRIRLMGRRGSCTTCGLIHDPGAGIAFAPIASRS